LAPQLQQIHHITAITGDARRNVDFYARVLGLRLVKKTVNFDAPEVYHLYYGDERGTPGSLLTFFEFPGVRRAAIGTGMITSIDVRVGSEAALDFWQERLGAEGTKAVRNTKGLTFQDPEGLEFNLVVAQNSGLPLRETPSGVPPEHALHAFAGVTAAGTGTDSDQLLVEVLGFRRAREDQYSLDHASYEYARFERAGVQGAGSVHHIAWACPDADHEAWRKRLLDAGTHPTPIIDRFYFRSIYFREPSGVLFEIATLGPGFAIDEPEDKLGESLALPERYEPMRSWLEDHLTPITNPRGGAPVG
jgi:glyoxalase family protein